MTLKLIVDYREAHVITELDTLKIPYCVENLDIGDFQLHTASDEIIGIWERKTYSDLASSVSDSRYREQKHRLTTSSARYKGYIIEGNCPNPARKYRTLHPGSLESIKIGLSCRDGFNVLHSTGTAHTAIVLGKLLKKIPEYMKDDRSTGALQEKYHSALVQSAVSSVKKENYTPETCYLAQLSQLPQVSVTTAKAISERWSNMGALTAAILRDRDGTTAEIRELKTGSAGGGSGRRLGESVANKIIGFLVPAPRKVIVIKKAVP
jgi:ERCC4-type nuclease